MRLWFWIETLSNFPWELVTNNFELRILRLSRSLRLLKTRKEASAANIWSRLLKVVVSAATPPFRASLPLLFSPPPSPVPHKQQTSILFMCHWIACLWWWVGMTNFNLFTPHGASWVFRHRVDTACPQLPNTPQHKLAADAALDSMMGLLGQKGNNFTGFQAAVLRHNWRHAWCENPPTAPIYPKLYADTDMINSLPVGELTHDFKLYLGSRVDELPENSGAE